MRMEADHSSVTFRHSSPTYKRSWCPGKHCARSHVVRRLYQKTRRCWSTCDVLHLVEMFTGRYFWGFLKMFSASGRVDVNLVDDVKVDGLVRLRDVHGCVHRGSIGICTGFTHLLYTSKAFLIVDCKGSVIQICIQGWVPVRITGLSNLGMVGHWLQMASEISLNTILSRT
jgi:hypothetical protein